MSSEDVLLKIDTHYCKSCWRDVDVGNDQLCIPYISFYGKLFQVGIRWLFGEGYRSMNEDDPAQGPWGRSLRTVV